MIGRLRNWLTEPMVRGLDPDGHEISIAHRTVLERKAVLRRLFKRFYRECRVLDLRYFGDRPGVRIEIGSGSGFMKDVLPNVFTSDIKPLPFVDMVVRAEELPFADNSLRAIYAINVFHHQPEPRAFFRELIRVLRPGGGAVLIEPYHGPVARFFFARIHAMESFDMNVQDWSAGARSELITNANQALSYIVFTRDRDMLGREFPELEVLLDRPHTQLLYILSGGVNFRQLVPDSLAFAAVLGDRLLKPLNRLVALQHTVVLRKRELTDAWAASKHVG